MGCSGDKVEVQEEDGKSEEYSEIDLEKELQDEEDKNTEAKKNIKRRKKKKKTNNQETIPIDKDILSTKPKEKNELEDTILEIENEEKNICDIFNKKEKEIELKYLSQYYINPKKEKVDFSYSNQIIVSLKKKLF